MFEKCNPSHPDKLADRIAGAIVDLAYLKVNEEPLCYNKHPKVAVEVLLGHNRCFIINETSEHFEKNEICDIVARITSNAFLEVEYIEVPQDIFLAANQEELHCGDNGIFKGVRTNIEEIELTRIVKLIYDKYPFDGKYIMYDGDIIACQSNCKELPIDTIAFNPLGYWTGGIDVDSGATNRKLGSDMGRAVTGGGLHGKDLTKADVSVNIYCHLMAQKNECFEINGICAIGDITVKIENKEIHFADIVKTASNYIKEIGGFEKLAEWGLIR